jgi:DNA-binding XRE family transcriptional regulator
MINSINRLHIFSPKKLSSPIDNLVFLRYIIGELSKTQQTRPPAKAGGWLSFIDCWHFQYIASLSLCQVKLSIGGDNLSFKTARKKAGLTLRQVAEEMDVTDAAVAQWESGATSPRAKLLPTLAQLYGCTVDELLKEE